MMATDDMSSASSFDGSLFQSEIIFPDSPHLLGDGSKIAGALFPPGLPAADASTSEELVGDIKWERHVDEADKIDCIVAVSSGVLAGLIDVIFVGELSFERDHLWGRDQVEQFVMRIAHAEGYKGDNLKDAIKVLEKDHPFAADGNANDFGGGLQHHFRDFSHHFSIGGLACSIFAQFTGLAIGTDIVGNLIIREIPSSHKQYLGKNFQEKLAFGTIEWFFHMVSDMAGSSGSIGEGVGIPGPLASLMKELSALPFFKDSVPKGDGFRQWLSKLFNGTLLAKRDSARKIMVGPDGKPLITRFDLRTEIGVLGEVGRQAIPVLIYQCMVRGFYFARRTCMEISDLGIHTVKGLGRIAPEDILPWGNSAVNRMVTIASGVFVMVDMSDAAVRAIKSERFSVFLLRINYVGVGTFVIACHVDYQDVMAERRIEERERPEESFERGLSDLGCLKLNFQQARILHSVEHALVEYDIDNEKYPKRVERKKAWLDEWSTKVAETVGLVWVTNHGYFLEGDALYGSIDKILGHGGDEGWLWLIATEVLGFAPYRPLHGENDKKYKGLKVGSNYLSDVFAVRQQIVGPKDFATLKKTMGEARDALDGTMTKRVIGVAGVAVAVAATGGLAFYFAPAIAPILATVFGVETTAGLSGAALTSASLAFFGGGAIAAGGAGMAGGTALIAGGGALLGAVGGSSISAAATMALMTDGSYVLDECSKLEAYCQVALLGEFGDTAAVLGIHGRLNQRIIELDVEIEALRRKKDSDEDDAKDKNELAPQKMLKILNKSRGYLKRTSDSLTKMLMTAQKKEPSLSPVTNDMATK